TLGDYKQVGGVYWPHSMETNVKGSPEKAKITFDKVETNVPLENSRFRAPGSPPPKDQPPMTEDVLKTPPKKGRTDFKSVPPPKRGRATARRLATASTSPPMAERTGPTWVSRSPSGFPRLWLIRVTRMSFTSACRESCGATARSAASIRPPTAARVGPRS